MKRAVFIGIIFTICGANTVFGQFPQKERFRQRIEASTKANDDLEHDRRLEEEAALPVPKLAVMNVDVQMVLSKAEHKTFAEAKAAEAKKIVDGDPLWLYVKFKGTLGDYVLTSRNPADREKLRYTLFAEIAPRGDVTALYQHSLQFAKEDLAATELKINLSPGMFGRNRSMPVFLVTSGAARNGVWNNDLRLTNSLSMPRGLTENLATTPLTLDVSAGPAKYRKIDSQYYSIVLRGTTDLTRLPAPGTFFSEDVRGRVVARLAAEKIDPIKIHFSGDDWEEFASFVPVMKKSRKVFATFTYRRGETCSYGVAEIVEVYDFMNGKYAEAEMKLQKDLPVPCAEIS